MPSRIGHADRSERVGRERVIFDARPRQRIDELLREDHRQVGFVVAAAHEELGVAAAFRELFPRDPQVAAIKMLASKRLFSAETNCE